MAGTAAGALAVAVALAASCSGGASVGRRAAPLAPAVTRLDPPLASHRCAGGARSCACVASGGDEKEHNPVGPGLSRFEFALYNTVRNEAELRVAGLEFTLHPSGEGTAAECWYVDLGPGSHPVAYRLAPEDGDHVTLGLRIRRYAEAAVEDGGPVAPAWYRVLDLKCGAGAGVECERTDLAAAVASTGGHTADACGQVELKNLRWEAFAGPPGAALDELSILTELMVGPSPTKPPCPR